MRPLLLALLVSGCATSSGLDTMDRRDAGRDGGTATRDAAPGDAAAPRDSGRDLGSDPADAGDGCAAGESRCGSSCTDTQTDPANCGACGNDCSSGVPFGTTSLGCVSSACQYACQAGYVDLNNDEDEEAAEDPVDDKNKDLRMSIFGYTIGPYMFGFGQMTLDYSDTYFYTFYGILANLAG